MSERNEFGVVKDLFENVAIFSNDFSLLYIGNYFKKLLKEINIDCSKLGYDEFPSDEQNILFEKLEVCKNNETGISFFLPGLENELLVFSSQFYPQNIFTVGFKKKIYHLSKIEYDLKERVKELQCLYSISKEFDKSENFSDALVLSTQIIQKAFQFPDDVTVEINIAGKKYLNRPLLDSSSNEMLRSDIITGETKKGEIKVYSKNRLGFLIEEQKLIDEIAGKISNLIEKEERTKYLEKQQKILTAKNDALLRLTEECFQKREKLSTFFKAITDPIYVIDSDFNIIMSNKDEIGESGKCYKKLFNQETICTDCAGAESFKTSLNTFKEKQSLNRHYALRAYPILGLDGKVERVLEVCRDITSQKYLETQLIQSYKLASLGKLVAGVAHEINNPNTFILGNLKIVHEAFDDIFPILDKHYKENKDLNIARLKYDVFKENISLLVNDMIKGAERTKKIVMDLRNFAKKDDGALTDDVDINDIIKNNLTITLKQLKKHAKVEIDLHKNIPTFKGNANKIEQVLVNLTMNAADAVQTGEGLVKIKTDFIEDTQEVILSMSDNGIGMDKSLIKNIFDPFFTTKREKGGTGLGLSITYGIVKELNGKIDVDSKVGEGTTFTIRIPADKK